MAKARILVVEDEKTTAKNIEKSLEELGYIVLAVISTGEIAFQKAEELCPDLVLMDIVLPGKTDGIEAADQIRNHLNIPVIYLTANADDVTLQRAKITEPFGYILKPFKRTDLAINIENTLYKYRIVKELKMRLRQQAVVSDLGQLALTEVDLDALMHETVTFVARTLNVEYCKVLELLPDGRTLLLRSGVGWDEGLVGHATVSTEKDSQVGYTLHSRKPVIVNDLKTETRFSGPPFLHEHNVVSGISVIIQGQKEPWGVLGVHTTELKIFNNNDINFVQSVANILAAAIRRKQSEEKIEHLASFPRMDINPILEVDSSKNISYYNNAAVNFLKKMDVRNDLTIFLPKDIDDIIKELGNRKEIQLYRETEINGFIFAVDIHLLPKVNTIRICLHNITDHKRMEGELLKVQKLESLGILAGGIAHDFNNILTSIMCNTTLAAMCAKSNDKVSAILAKVERASLRAKTLTLQLLTFSKGGMPVKKLMSISGLLKDSTEFALKGSNVWCEFYIKDDLFTVNVDEGQINQVISNLVINGKQAMPQGGMLKVTAENVCEEDSKKIAYLKPDKYIRISFEDKGVGIPEKSLPKVFDPYFTTKQSGSGLGLASSYSIVKKHGGFITAESKVGAGSTFFVYLPASSKKILKKEETKIKDCTGKGKILVMEDDKILRDMAKDMLNSLGYETECAKDGDETIKKYINVKKDGRAFNLILMDLTIKGGMGGKEAIRKLRKISPEAKAIVYSGYSNDPVMANFSEYGFNGAICKPFKIQDMNELIHKVIGD